MSAYKQHSVVQWKPTDRSLRNHKVELLDSCSFGELHRCKLVAENEAGDFKLFGGFINWFFKNPVLRKLFKTQWGLDADRIGINGVVHERRIVKTKPHG
jgi:hypothetical protein